mmetsp:Transcript_35947/g.115509  ORF Transcript_35947/g.115509 Transcript_35947/m.115509 type:complete len:112 (-) Transcript_35947:105-440(-)
MLVLHHASPAWPRTKCAKSAATISISHATRQLNFTIVKPHFKLANAKTKQKHPTSQCAIATAIAIVNRWARNRLDRPSVARVRRIGLGEPMQEAASQELACRRMIWLLLVA